jgi:hypothetical protein
MIGMRVSERLPIFVSGVGFPDCMVVGADALERGGSWDQGSRLLRQRLEH